MFFLRGQQGAAQLCSEFWVPFIISTFIMKSLNARSVSNWNQNLWIQTEQDGIGVGTYGISTFIIFELPHKESELIINGRFPSLILPAQHPIKFSKNTRHA